MTCVSQILLDRSVMQPCLLGTNVSKHLLHPHSISLRPCRTGGKHRLEKNRYRTGLKWRPEPDMLFLRVIGGAFGFEGPVVPNLRRWQWIPRV